MTDIFQDTGGARVGRSYWIAMNATIPFATLEASSDSIWLKVKGMKLFNRLDTLEIPRENIVRLSLYKGMFSKGIRIEHNIKHYDPFIIFWSMHIDTTRKNLANLGYTIHD